MKSLQLCSDILDTTFNLKLSISDICHVLIALKLSRNLDQFKKDNLIDIINYTAISLFNKQKNDSK